MASPPTVSTLHPEIKYLVLRMEEESMEEIRRISPSWNRTVIEYLKDSRNLLPLERLYLSSGFVHADYYDYGAQDAQMRWDNFEAESLLHMYAIVPNRAKARLGLGNWLKTHQNFPGATEVTCAPQKIDMSAREILKLLVKLGIATLALITLGVFACFGWALITSKTIGLLFFFLLFLVVTCYFLSVTLILESDNEMDSRRLNRLRRFFSSFSRIEFAVLDTFNDLRILDRTTSAFGQIQIEKIEIRLSNCDQAYQKRIVELTRKHGIKHISIVACKCSQDQLRKFLSQLIKLGATVNIYDAVRKDQFYKEVLSYFHRPQEFWKKMESDLANGGITLKLSTIKDDGFKTTQCASGVRARLACVKTGGECHDDLVRARGYYR